MPQSRPAVQVTTVVRWLLRVVLVLFLAWLEPYPDTTKVHLCMLEISQGHDRARPRGNDGNKHCCTVVRYVAISTCWQLYVAHVD